MDDNTQKTIDGLHYEIGGYIAENRILKHCVEGQKMQIQYLVEALLQIRQSHREAKQYEASDAIREFLVALGFEVNDN